MTANRFIIMDNVPPGTHSSIWDKQKQHNQGIGDELWLGEVVAMLNEGVILAEENEQLKTTIQQLRTDNTKQKKLLNTTMKENEQLKCGNKNLKATLNDFINICNRLQSNPTDKQTLTVARDMLQNMGVDLE